MRLTKLAELPTRALDRFGRVAVRVEALLAGAGQVTVATLADGVLCPLAPSQAALWESGASATRRWRGPTPSC